MSDAKFIPYRVGAEIPLLGGDGRHVVAWCLPADGSPSFALYERHWDYKRGCKCGGMVQWRDYWPSPGLNRMDHELVGGGPHRPISELTLSPSLLCYTCGSHGFIRDGKWIDA